MKNKIKVTERGWAGHYIASSYCRFRRNTLLEFGEKRIVVSTVGNYVPPIVHRDIDKNIQTNIGAFDRKYETMCFEANWDGTYWDANVSKQIDFKSKWALCELSFESDQKANDMHEKVVEEMKDILLTSNQE